MSWTDIGPAQAPVSSERQRQLIAMRLTAPKRSTEPQHDASELSLFRVANEPELF